KVRCDIEIAVHLEGVATACAITTDTRAVDDDLFDFDQDGNDRLFAARDLAGHHDLRLEISTRILFGKADAGSRFLHRVDAIGLGFGIAVDDKLVALGAFEAAVDGVASIAGAAYCAGVPDKGVVVVRARRGVVALRNVAAEQIVIASAANDHIVPVATPYCVTTLGAEDNGGAGRNAVGRVRNEQIEAIAESQALNVPERVG